MMDSSKPKLYFSVIGLNHGHIYEMVRSLQDGGGEIVSFYAEEADLVNQFSKHFPNVKLAQSKKEILEDESIQLIASASIPDQRALLGIETMLHGKDFIAAKPAIISLKQLAEVKKVQAETKRIFSIYYSERFGNPATIKAGELVKNGEIGKVIQTIGLGPHLLNASSRESWFFEREKYGGIICDIGSHQFDQFLFFTASTEAEIVTSQIANFNHPQYPNFEDFGDVMVRGGNGGAGYIRVDWFSPAGLPMWGDARLTILGTDGYIEVRKNIDIAGKPGGNHLFLADKNGVQYFDCKDISLPFGEQIINDILNCTETAMSQNHCFLATELALKAQKKAQKI
jgi:predicted dehydrogenase